MNYKRSGLDASMFQTLQPGESVTASVNAAKTYKLAGITAAQVTAIQGFKYVTGSSVPNTLKEMTACEDLVSNTVTVTPRPEQGRRVRSLAAPTQGEIDISILFQQLTRRLSDHISKREDIHFLSHQEAFHNLPFMQHFPDELA